MDVQTAKLPALTTSATLGHTWLRHMDSAASTFNLSLMFCMTWCRHVLASVELPSVTQARAERSTPTHTLP
jgi:hypothetical protein